MIIFVRKASAKEYIFKGYAVSKQETINISNNPDNHRWPIYTETQKLILNPGDAFVCEGNKVIHWREEHQGQWSTQLMLHYQIDE